MPVAMSYSTHTTLLTRLNGDFDPTAWTEFHHRYCDLLRGYARQHGLQPADCDDIVQEVFVILSQSLSDFVYDPRKGKFRSYLKTLTIRAINQRLRQKYDRRGQSDIAEEADRLASNESNDQVWEEEWRKYHVRLAMGRVAAEFNERDRLAFTQYAVGGQSAAETSKTLGLSLDQVYQAKSRVLKRLAQLIAEQIEDEG